jgi:phosphatidylserine/phosphatidylglycerophosphate/cardiolipin synthase-like enzyme
MKFVDIKDNYKVIKLLVDNAEEFLVLISPFNDFNGWDELKDSINRAVDRGVDVKYYVREGEGYNGIEGLNVKVYEVPGLHAKMYRSEKETYISSGNLTNDTNINWYIKLDELEEVKELTEKFFNEQIVPVAFTI